MCTQNTTCGRATGTETVVADNVIRILPLGDSITQEASWQASYRKTLWLMLKEHGVNVDFVGSSREVHEDKGNVIDAYDQDHESHWGFEVFTAGQVGVIQSLISTCKLHNEMVRCSAILQQTTSG